MTLIHCLKKGYFAQVRFRLEMGADGINNRDEHGRTPLSLCALIKEDEWAESIARNLLEKGAKVGLTDKLQRSALHYAAICQKARLVELFLRALDFDLNAKDKYGRTALYYGSLGESEEIAGMVARQLAKYGLTGDVADKHGISPLDVAKELHLSSLEPILRHGRRETPARPLEQICESVEVPLTASLDVTTSPTEEPPGVDTLTVLRRESVSFHSDADSKSRKSSKCSSEEGSRRNSRTIAFGSSDVREESERGGGGGGGGVSREDVSQLDDRPFPRFSTRASSSRPFSAPADGPTQRVRKEYVQECYLLRSQRISKTRAHRNDDPKLLFNLDPLTFFSSAESRAAADRSQQMNGWRNRIGVLLQDLQQQNTASYRRAAMYRPRTPGDSPPLSPNDLYRRSSITQSMSRMTVRRESVLRLNIASNTGKRKGSVDAPKKKGRK